MPEVTLNAQGWDSGSTLSPLQPGPPQVSAPSGGWRAMAGGKCPFQPNPHRGVNPTHEELSFPQGLDEKFSFSPTSVQNSLSGEDELHRSGKLKPALPCTDPCFCQAHPHPWTPATHAGDTTRHVLALDLSRSWPGCPQSAEPAHGLHILHVPSLQCAPGHGGTQLGTSTPAPRWGHCQHPKPLSQGMPWARRDPGNGGNTRWEYQERRSRHVCATAQTPVWTRCTSKSLLGRAPVRLLSPSRVTNSEQR